MQQKIALEKVQKCIPLDKFYLAGGTAIAIKYNHRTSEDFDFFTLPEFSDIFEPTILANKLSKSEAKIQLITLGMIKFTIDSIWFSFFEYPYKLLNPLEYSSDLKIYLASDLDIACMKAVAIAQRGSKKDFFDLWFLLKKNKVTVENFLNLLKLKYPNFEKAIFLKALSYFEDAEKETYADIDEKWEEIKRYFRFMVSNLIYNGFLTERSH